MAYGVLQSDSGPSLMQDNSSQGYQQQHDWDRAFDNWETEEPTSYGVMMEDAGDPYSTGFGGFDAPYYADSGAGISYEAEGDDSNWLADGLKGVNWNKWLGLGAGLLSQYMGSKADQYGSKPRGGGGGGGGGGAQKVTVAAAPQYQASIAPGHRVSTPAPDISAKNQDKHNG
jgi:hypothetical protein